MAAPIAAIPSTPAIAPSTSSGAVTKPGAAGFGDALANMINATDQSSRSANTAVEQMLDGSGDVHDAMIALQRAELTLQLTVQVKNKLVQASQDIMRMPV